MSSSGQQSSEVFEIRKVRKLVELMNDHDLSEIDLRQGEQRIRLRKGGDPVVVAAPAAAAPAAPVAAAAPATPSAAAPVAAAPAAEVDDADYITSPMVGSFYTAANPESAAFVSVGDRIGPDTTVCIVEAMKVFNELKAECSGVIAEILVENGDPVEFGQKLFKITK